MTRYTLPEYCHIPLYDCICCRSCRNRVAAISDCILTVQRSGIFNRVFNVEVSDDVNNHRQQDVNTVARTCCVQCGMLLGWQFIAVPQPSMFIREGRFLLRLHMISLWNGIQLLSLNEEQDLDANEENADRDEDANEQVPNEQDLGTYEQNAHQDGCVNEQVPNEADGGANEGNADQNGGVNEQVPNEQNGGANEQNADQDGGVDEQVRDQDVDIAEGMGNIDPNANT